jgi:hypothetical protein
MKKGGRTPQAGAHDAAAGRADPPDQLAPAGARRGFPPNYLHETWRDWLYWDVELDKIPPPLRMIMPATHPTSAPTIRMMITFMMSSNDAAISCREQ